MKEIIIKNQKELDDIKVDIKGVIYIEGGTMENPLILFLNYEYAQVIVRGSAQIIMWGNSVVQDMWGEAMVSCYGKNKIISHGNNIIRTIASNKKNLILKLSKFSHLIVIPDFKPDFTTYKKHFPVEIKGKDVILYKAVHKKDGKYLSDRNSLEYKIGETLEHKNDPSKEQSCSYGIHVAFKKWAISYGKEWKDFALLECAVPIKDIVVSKDCDGKVRTSTVKVLREVEVT